MKWIDGRKHAALMEAEITEEIDDLNQGGSPGLSCIVVGEDPASLTYVERKEAACQRVGIHSRSLSLPYDTTTGSLIRHIESMNRDPQIDGILIQQPLPPHIALERVVSAILPKKDVDGFHPLNMGKLMRGELGGVIPCTPLGIYHLLIKEKIPLAGREVLIVGRSDIVGKPMASLLCQKGIDATVTLAHSKSPHLDILCRRADIAIIAAGVPHLVKSSWIKTHAVLFDVGIHRTSEGKLIGDIDPEGIEAYCQKITPVPGGVGPMTIASLLNNCLLLYKRRKGDNR
ncbi:MAG: bifunctional 5,10-methylenetetrahydrofolate dehydrogenase/5,10-methenyltetrahydrofolate cyclohydrolase [Chlamydiota bacterium]|nr:bifunctional 5,10-methylenetetrahydrofolate dehydrogenase/5,10-methenyltetrahydrofolate cyclohydrolase [Chlamydiota bacterium]